MGFIDLGKIQAMSIRGFMGEFLILSADDLWSDYVTQLNDVFFLDLVDNLNEALHQGTPDMTEDRILLKIFFSLTILFFVRIQLPRPVFRE